MLKESCGNLFDRTAAQECKLFLARHLFDACFLGLCARTRWMALEEPQEAGTTASSVARAFAGVVLSKSGNNVLCHTCIEGTIRALKDIDVPSFVTLGIFFTQKQHPFSMPPRARKALAHRQHKAPPWVRAGRKENVRAFLRRSARKENESYRLLRRSTASSRHS